jgi:ACS family allantoate permease-like MFS transporter
LDTGKYLTSPQALIPNEELVSLTVATFSIGNIIGPQTFRPQDAPRYVPAEITIIACWGVCLLDMLFIYWYCRKENARKALARADPSYVKLENQEWLDLTDRENPEFVYTL